MKFSGIDECHKGHMVCIRELIRLLMRVSTFQELQVMLWNWIVVMAEIDLVVRLMG